MLLGVDAGGTSTRAVLLDGSGRCLGYGTAGGGNPVSWGPVAAAAQIAAAARTAVAQAGSGDGPLGSTGDADPAGGSGDGRRGVAVLAMAGGSAFSGTQEVQAALAAAGLEVAVTVASDLLATFCAGTAALSGYALVAGTGAAAVRVRDGEVAGSVDGLGWLLGDDGSGFWIGRRVARAALAGLDGRGPATSLTALLMRELGIVADGATIGGRPGELQAAVDLIYRLRPVELSRFAELAFRAASETKDRVAAEIVRTARDRLVQTLQAARSRDVAGPVVMGGGIARRLPGFADAICRAFSASPADVVTVTDGAVGAGVLALRQSGVTVDDAVFRRLARSVAQRRAPDAG